MLSGALDLPDFARSPARYRPVNWIPPRWDWVDPLKDIQAQVLAMEAGIISRRKVVEATGYDVEEIDRENAADAKRAGAQGLHYRTSPGETQGARATPRRRQDDDRAIVARSRRPRAQPARAGPISTPRPSGPVGCLNTSRIFSVARRVSQPTSV